MILDNIPKHTAASPMNWTENQIEAMETLIAVACSQFMSLCRKKPINFHSYLLEKNEQRKI